MVLQETMLDKTERVLALLTVLREERDRAVEDLAATRAEMDQMAAMLAQVESSVAETLDTTELAPEPTDKELAQELDDCRRALQAMKAELDQTKEELARAEFRVRSQASRMKRQSASSSAD